MPDHVWVEWVFQILFVILALYAVGRAVHGCMHSVTHQPYKTTLLLLVYYSAYLLLPFISWTLWQWSQGLQTAWQAVPMLGLAIFLVYARFIEPAVLVVRQTRITLHDYPALEQPLTIALLADIHIGLFSGRRRQLKRLVSLVNQQQPDVIVIAGDWTYEPNQHLVRDVGLLAGFNAPAYSVPGNHDEEIPGPPVQAMLKTALEAANIMPIEGKIVDLGAVLLIGVGDLWAGKVDMQYLPALAEQPERCKPWVIVAHNPDTVAHLPPLATRPLMLCGHTHGGQLELPWLTDYVLRKVSLLGFKKGLYQTPQAQVFVTLGTGLVGVPLRFRAPPTIDILHVQ